MRDIRFFTAYLALVVAQILICSYLNLSQFITLSILPAIVLCIPIRISPSIAVITAFITGFTVDFFSTGTLGMTSLALMPVAILRNPLIKLVFGEEVFARNEDISITRQGIPKMTAAVVIASAIFLGLYIMTESAGTRPFWAVMLKFAISLVCGTFFSMLIINLLSPERNSR